MNRLRLIRIRLVHDVILIMSIIGNGLFSVLNILGHFIAYFKLLVLLLELTFQFFL